MQSLQEKFAPGLQCFGCGPANQQGLQIKSIAEDDKVICTWQPAPHHQAFPGMLCGGIIGTLLDCHSNWSAAYFLMQQGKMDKPPCTVTAYYNVQLKRPTPALKPVHLVAELKEIKTDRAIITASLFSDELLCASCEGMFVAVKEGHPAYHRW